VQRLADFFEMLGSIGVASLFKAKTGENIGPFRHPTDEKGANENSPAGAGLRSIFVR
jgi:hypothetical protein